MKKLNLYLAVNIFYITLIVTLVIITIDFVFGMLGEIRSIGHNGYTWHNATLYILYRLPSDLSLILPITGFLGTLIAFLILSSKSELIAMRAAGLSLKQLAKAVLLTGGLLLVFYYILSLFIAPYSRHLSYLEQNFSNKNQNILILSSETWLKSGNHFLLMGEVLPDGEIHDVTDFIVQSGNLTSVRQIERIHLQENGTWTLTGVSTLLLSPTGVTKTTEATRVEPSLISADILPALAMQPEEMMIHTLANYIEFRESNGLDVKAYELQFWNRIFAPLMLPILMLIAIPFGLASTRSSMQVNIIAGMVVGFSFYIISQFFGSVTQLSALPAFLGAALPPLIFGIFAAVLFNLRR